MYAARLRPRPPTVALAAALCLMVVLSLLVIAMIERRMQGDPGFTTDHVGVTVVYVLAIVVTTSVGAVLAIRRPRHPVGWLFLVMAASIALTGVADTYAKYGTVVRPGSWRGAELAAVIGSAVWVPWLVIIALVLQLTPTGKPLSPFWRRVAVATVAAGVVVFVAILLDSQPLDPPFAHVRNPLAWRSSESAIGVVRAISGIAVGIGLIASAVPLHLRFRRSTGVARQQLLWLALVVIPLPLFVVVAFVAAATQRTALLAAATAGFVVVIPIAVGLSVAKYHLYEVDRILSRAATYVLLTSALVTAYAAAVVALSRTIGHQAGDTPVAPVAATLLTVSIAAPVRRRLQDAVDRRFNRRRFDALRVVYHALRRPDSTLAVERILREALRDPSLRIDYWVDAREQWVGASGQPAMDEPTALVVRRGERLVARVTFDGDAVDRHLVEAIVTELVTELENVGLRAAVALQLVEVQQSRARIAAAQLDERRSLERNLHDGAQQRLLALAMQLRAAGIDGDSARLHAAASAAVEQLQAAVSELRELANGLNPAVLNDGGLGAALDDLAARTPVTIDVDAVEERFAPQTEATAWFIACEAVANAVKHAAPTRITVTVRREQRSLVVTVADDGVGGAKSNGRGLRGLADRAEAAGGRLAVVSDSGVGTTVEAVLPCG